MASLFQLRRIVGWDLDVRADRNGEEACTGLLMLVPSPTALDFQESHDANSLNVPNFSSY